MGTTRSPRGLAAAPTWLSAASHPASLIAMDRRWIAMAAVALGCEPLVPDGSAGTDGSSSGTPSESASTTANASTTAHVSTTEAPSTTTTTDVTATDDGDDTSAGLDPTTHWCQPSCETVTDCCITLLDDPTCVGGLGEYPLDFECEAGACISNGCVDDEDCELNEVQDLRCVLDDTRVPYCSPVCVDDGDCTAAGFAGWPCVDGICRDLPPTTSARRAACVCSTPARARSRVRPMPTAPATAHASPTATAAAGPTMSAGMPSRAYRCERRNGGSARTHRAPAPCGLPG
jgi:hypothetical protein